MARDAVQREPVSAGFTVKIHDFRIKTGNFDSTQVRNGKIPANFRRGNDIGKRTFQSHIRCIIGREPVRTIEFF